MYVRSYVVPVRMRRYCARSFLCEIKKIINEIRICETEKVSLNGDIFIYRYRSMIHTIRLGFMIRSRTPLKNVVQFLSAHAQEPLHRLTPSYDEEICKVATCVATSTESSHPSILVSN